MTIMTEIKTTPIFCPKCHQEALRLIEDGGIIEVKVGARSQIRTRRGSMSNISFGCAHCGAKIKLFKDVKICQHEFHDKGGVCIHCEEPFDERIDQVTRRKRKWLRLGLRLGKTSEN